MTYDPSQSYLLGFTVVRTVAMEAKYVLNVWKATSKPQRLITGLVKDLMLSLSYAYDCQIAFGPSRG
jgi:hypothetical protein